MGKRFGMALAAMAALLLVLAGCGSSDGAGSSEGATGGVAAVVNGVDIMEDDVTAYIQAFRASGGYDDDDSWASYLGMYGMTPETLREQVITSYFAARQLVLMAAEEEGIVVSDEEVDEQVSMMRANYSSDEAWQEALEQSGFNEDDYREEVRASIVNERLREKITAEVGEVTDEDMLEAVQTYASSFDGAKRVSHILFNIDDEETAQSVLDQLNSGQISFEDAAAQYSQDGSAENGGDVGWDMLPGSSSQTFVDEFQEALDQLAVGEMSGLVESQFGYHILLCTDQFNAPENPEDITSVDQVPDVLVEYLETMLQSSNETNAYTEWLNAYEEESDLTINPMPEGLPYDVDMSAYEASLEDLEELAGDDASVEVTSEGEAEGDVADEAADAEADAEAEGEATEQDAA